MKYPVSMRKSFVFPISLGLALILIMSFIYVGTIGSKKTYMGEMIHHDISAPLSSMYAQPVAPFDKEAKPGFENGEAPEKEGEGKSAEEARGKTVPQLPGLPAQVDAVSQSRKFGSKVANGPKMPVGSSSWNGVGAGNYAPPDTSMDVSATEILQVTNVQIQGWNKAGNVVLSKRPTNSIFSGFGGLCASTNDGDATVVYDRQNLRWIVSQFAISGANGSSVPYLQCVAVSSTSSILGSWNRYSFAYSVFPDYPKLSVWPGTYYTTFNGFGATGRSFSGAIICGYDQAAMLIGAAVAKQACQTLTGDYSILVAGVEGSNGPPANTPAYALSLGSTSSLNSYRLNVDWSNSSPTLSVTGPAAVSVSPYAKACSGGACVTQSGTTNKLDSLGDRLMYRYVYRNLGTRSSLLATHSVTSNSYSAIRWYEFTDAQSTSTSTPTVYQQGTFDGTDSKHRWMPSISSDRLGNIAIGYSISSSSMFPSIAIAGRLATDILGTFPQGESIIFSGLGSQTGTLTRWGDYAATVTDPADDCTFWTSTEYQPANGSFNWATRILSFKYPSCPATSQTISSIAISPALANVKVGNTQQFSAVALDSNGQALTTQPTFSWTKTSGVGSIDTNGLFSAENSTGGAVISVSGGGLTASTSVTVVPIISLSASPASVIVTKGSRSSTTINITRTATTEPISFFNSTLPNGVTISYSLNPATGNSLTVTIAATKSAKTGNFNLVLNATINGSSPAVNTAITIPVKIQ